jgi:hypothetical protein
MVEYVDSIYKGGYSSFSPDFGNYVGYRMNFSDIGTSLDARTADQVKDISKQLNTGIRVVEVAAHDPGVFDSMPKEQFKEINRMAKLLKITPTMHAPMIDPTGITEQGWNQMNQEVAKRQLLAAVERGQKLNPDGNTVITMHASTVNLPPSEMKIKENGQEITKSVLLVSPQGTLKQIKEEERYFPEDGEKFSGKPQVFNPEIEKNRLNEKIWLEAIQNVTYYTDFADRGMNNEKFSPEEKKAILNVNPENYDEIKKKGIMNLQDALKNQKGVEHSEVYLKKAYESLKSLFDMAYINAKEEERKKLGDYASEMTRKMPAYKNLIKNPEKIHEFAEDIEKGAKLLKGIKAEIFKPLGEYAQDKSAETFGHIAFESYKKFKDKSPIISIENHPAQESILTTGEDLKQVIDKARNNFVNLASKELGMSRNEAKKQAEKFIGATWDVGHINMLKKYGYDDKDIIKETEKIAKYVKHVHLSDNFGFQHTELPMGMGNVPVKEIMQKLGQAGFKGKKVAEALSWWQHFSNNGVNSAIVPTMQAFGASGFQGAPHNSYWSNNQGQSANYLGFPSAYMPERHFSLYGSSFSSLPQELGGQIPGTNSRFSGTPNA